MSELNKAVADLVVKATQAAEAAGKFAVEQLPDVAHQYPIQEMPLKGVRYFAPMPDFDDWFSSYECDKSHADHLLLSRGLLFTTKEAAIANAKAMCGIDPEA